MDNWRRKLYRSAPSLPKGVAAGRDRLGASIGLIWEQSLNIPESFMFHGDREVLLLHLGVDILLSIEMEALHDGYSLGFGR